LRVAVEQGKMEAIPMLRACAAVSVGIFDGAPLLDLCYVEDSEAEVDMNIIMDSHGQFIEVQGCAERGAFSRSQMDTMLSLAEKGVHELLQAQREALAHG